MKGWLDKYEQGGMVLNQKTNDNYGLRDNPSDSSVSLPQGFVGLGNNTKGRNYSPAWGGQFADGGLIPKDIELQHIRNGAPSEGPHAQKTMPSAQGGEQIQPQILQNFEEFRNSPEGKFQFENMERNRIAKKSSGRVDYSDIDPITDIALPLAGIAGTVGKQAIKQGAKKIGKYLTEETALKNAYKLNPYAFKPNPESAYRMIGGKEGYLDAINSGEIRAMENGVYEDAHFNMGLPLNPNRLSSEELLKAGSPGGYKGPYMVERRWADNAWNKHAMTDVFKDNPEMFQALKDLGKDKDVWGKYGNLQTNNNAVRLYKEHWLRGYKEIPKQENGGITKDNAGYWNPDNWGKPVEINSNDITMQGVNQPLLGISDTGDKKMMLPGKDYKFKGKKVTEYPMAQNGLRQEQKSLQNLDNLTNFSLYDKSVKGSWLNKYS